MPLKCEACGQCHTCKGGCPPTPRERVRQSAGPKPQPKDEPGEWELRCDKHRVSPEVCCQGAYTAHWRWVSVSAPPDPLSDLQRRARRCVTHHAACPCGELRRVELEARVADLETALQEARGPMAAAIGALSHERHPQITRTNLEIAYQRLLAALER